MSPAEVAFLVGLFFAFYVTVKHPFVVATIIALFIIYLRYFAEKIEFESHSQQPRKVLLKDQNGNDTKERHPAVRKKTQREILAEIEASEPPAKEKFSKLLLTYQVPNMTQYYEDLIQFIQT